MRTQINATDYARLKPGTTGMCYLEGQSPIPVVFQRCDGVHVWIKGQGIRPQWHIGLHAGLLTSLFSWDLNK